MIFIFVISKPLIINLDSDKFIFFKTDISKIELPKKFTFPFYYQPHLLAKIAAEELQEYLATQNDFTHNFGFDGVNNELAIGKMFGVLVVQNSKNEIGYLAAYSGKLEDNSNPKKFVPPVFNIRKEGSYFLKEEAAISNINKQLSNLQNNLNYLSLKDALAKLKIEIELDMSLERKKLKRYKKERKQKKAEFRAILSKEEYDIFCTKLAQQSFNNQFYIKELQEYYTAKIDKKAKELSVFESKISSLKRQRKEKSNALQHYIFTNYQFLNQQKKTKSLIAIFDDKKDIPPAGSGECAAPKLLQYAFAQNLKPICMSEFWWGISPNSEVRKHLHFYPACQSRCKPILKHMLQGIALENNELLENLSEKKEIKIIFEDDNLLVIHKPHELLTVPGKNIKDSVFTRIKKEYPNATGPLIVHRLDMSTSGILLIAKTAETYQFLQSQFIKRTVKKRYVAVLNGKLTAKNGTISLPLRVDLEDRPRQLVCYEHGKKAETLWKVIQQNKNTTKVYFYPITGRTHQLRVHAAHKNGLNTAILGDDLYGTKSNRLHLHAEWIEFEHPSTKKRVCFTVPADF